jgi:hypothetical protein
LVIAFPNILASYAKDVGMSVPDDPEKFLENREEHPHFAVYCLLQLGTSMPNAMSARINAEVIAAIPVEEVTTMTLADFEARGFEHGVAAV